ncbi:hypothetical protein SAMN02910358_01706 [Lachnospiraceae bacterium XBB1006]|nr:hypothetical protein SAMN02910358_01706 [Lachnospiraceae bacterium XBB1006]
MKSKISCFKGVIMRRDWRFLIGICVVLTLFLYYRGVHRIHQAMRWSIGGAKNGYWDEKVGVLSGFSMESTVWVVALVAIVSALVCFHYLFDKRGIQMLHALPVSRTQLFVSHYVDGMIATLLPIFVNMIWMAAVLKKESLVQISCLYYGELMLAGFLFYSMMVLLIMICGVSFLPPILFLIFNYLYIGLLLMVGDMCQRMIFGFYQIELGSGDGYMEKLYMFSPLKYMSSAMGITQLESGKLVFVGEKLTWCYGVAAIIMVILAYVAYCRRPVESWGDFLTKPWLKVFFSLGITGCAEIIVFLVILRVEQSTRTIATVGKANALVVAVTTLGLYYVVSMIVRKTVRVWRKKAVYIPAIVMAIVLGGSIFVVQGQAKRYETAIPKADEIEAANVNVNMLFSEGEKVQTIEDVRALNKIILEQKSYIQNCGSTRLYNVEFHYIRKNKTSVWRRYAIPFVPQKVHEKNSLEYAIDKYFNRFEQVPAQPFKQKWDTVELFKNRKGESEKVAELPPMEMKEAILEDIKDGALKPLYFDAVENEIPGKNILVIKMPTCGYCYYNSTEFDGVDISNYEETVSQMTLRFNANCSHILKVLEHYKISLKELNEGSYVTY